MADNKTLEAICDKESNAKTISVDDSSIVITPGQTVTVPANTSLQGYKFIAKHWVNKDIKFDQIMYAGGERQKEQFIECALEYVNGLDDHYRAGFLRMYQRDFEGALNDAEQLLAKEPTNYDALKLKAVSKSMMGHDDAEKWYEKAAKYAPNEQAKVLWKYTNTEAGEYFRKKAATEQHAKPMTQPITPEQKAKIDAEAARKAAEHIKKMFSLDDVVQDNFEKKIILHMNGTFSIRNDASSGTFDYVEKCVKENKLNLLSYCVSEDTPEQVKVYFNFIEHAKKAFEKKCDFVSLGYVHLKNNEFEDALDCFETLKESEPDNYKIFAGSAVAKYMLGDRKSAQIDMLTAQELNANETAWLSEFWISHENEYKKQKSEENVFSKIKRNVAKGMNWVADKITLDDLKSEENHKAARMQIRQAYMENQVQHRDSFSGRTAYERKISESRA